MTDFLRTYQVNILFSCALVCLMQSVFVLVIKLQSIKKKVALAKIQISVVVLLAADAFCYMYKGIPGTQAFWMTRISNFLVYLFTLLALLFLNEYITHLFMGTGKFEKLPVQLLLGFIIPSIGTTFVVISQFTGMFYYFSDNNTYQRGPLFLLGFAAPIISLFIIASFVILHMDLIDKGIAFALIIFGVGPFLAGVAQIFLYGLSLINLSIWLAAVLLFCFALSDQNKELSKAAFTEVASGLPNAYGYLYEVDRIVNYGDITNYNAYYFDIVRMGNYNNRYGKAKGDEIIVNYSHAIKKRIEKDEILGRLGGNFFVALIKKENTEKFLELLSATPVDIEVGHEKVHLTLSAVAGVYEINTRRIAAGQIIGNTSVAINYAKNVAHKPYVFLDEDLETEFKRIRALEEQAKKGLSEKEFEAYYQPKVDTHGNTLCGAEALVRWRRKGKLIPPMEFVPIMEKNGTVCELDFYVLECVCKDIKDWLERGLEPVTVSVNFSRKNLGNPILAEAISKVVERYGIPKKYIQIEVTETLDEFPLDYLVGVVEALQRYGLTVAIDDFGTGSSSINLLKICRFNVLKIDRAFISYTNDKEKQLLADIIRMAKNIDISVIAEGVETEEMVDELKNMGCYEIQGFYFDKPLEKKDYEERLRNKQYR